MANESFVLSGKLCLQLLVLHRKLVFWYNLTIWLWETLRFVLQLSFIQWKCSELWWCLMDKIWACRMASSQCSLIILSAWTILKPLHKDLIDLCFPELSIANEPFTWTFSMWQLNGYIYQTELHGWWCLDPCISSALSGMTFYMKWCHINGHINAKYDLDIKHLLCLIRITQHIMFSKVELCSVFISTVDSSKTP